jgi:hypothetical protein
MITHTPSDFLTRISEKYNIPLIINEGEGGITQDWNFALANCKTKFATIAHQDDIYEARYAERVLGEMRKAKNPIIAFTDYSEIRNGRKTVDVKMLKIKRVMMIPLVPKCTRRSIFIRRRVLSMGDPICCPSVCYNLEKVERPVFENHFRSCEDWEAWEKLSKLKGEFIYINRPLMSHRIHEGSETTAIIHDHKRGEENMEMFSKFWPKPVAGLINRFYNKSEESNEL